jgi:hypothetical protein
MRVDTAAVKGKSRLEALVSALEVKVCIRWCYYRQGEEHRHGCSRVPGTARLNAGGRKGADESLRKAIWYLERLTGDGND